MSNKFKTLDAECLHKDSVVSFFNSMFKVSELISFSNEIFRDTGMRELYTKLTNHGKGQIPLGGKSNEWIDNGKECELLVPGAKSWQKGKIRIKVTLEFCPEEPEVEENLKDNHIQNKHKEQSLDDIRQQIEQIN